MMVGVCAAAIISAFVSVLLSGFGFKEKRLFGVLCTVVILLVLADGIYEIVSSLLKISELAGIKDAATDAIKAVGVGYVFGFTADTCTDLGENGIANGVVLAGRIEILLIAFPYFEKTVNLALELIK